MRPFQLVRRPSVRRFAAASLVLAAMAMTGCLRGPTHEKWVNQANDRWHEARGQLMLPMALQAFETGDLDRAEKLVTEALMLDEDNASFFLLGGRIELERGKLERAYHLFEKAIEFEPNLADAHYYKGIVLQRWTRHEAALEAYDKAYEIQPDEPHFLLSHCEMLVALDRKAEAIDLLESKLAYFDQNAGIRMAAAHLYAINGSRAKATEMLREASLLAPDDPKIQEELATALMSDGRYADAEQMLKSLLREPAMAQRYDLQRALGKALVAQAKHGEARDVYLGLTQREQANAENWIALGETSLQANDVGATLTAANRAISLAPDNHRGYLLSGMAWQKRGRPDNALRSFDRAAELAPESALPLILRGVTLQQAGRPDAAAVAYRAALQRQPGDERAQRLLQAVEVPTP